MKSFVLRPWWWPLGANDGPGLLEVYGGRGWKRRPVREIQRAYAGWPQHHPDVNKDLSAETQQFKEISEAYDVLSDP